MGNRGGATAEPELEAEPNRPLSSAQRKLRFYVVAKRTGDASPFFGIHHGDIGAWWGLVEESSGENNRPRFAVRRFGTLDEACDFFYLQCRVQQWQGPPRLREWPLRRR